MFTESRGKKGKYPGYWPDREKKQRAAKRKVEKELEHSRKMKGYRDKDYDPGKFPHSWDRGTIDVPQLKPKTKKSIKMPNYRSPGKDPDWLYYDTWNYIRKHQV